MGKLESKPTYTWRYWSPRQPMWRFSEHFEFCVFQNLETRKQWPTNWPYGFLIQQQFAWYHAIICSICSQNSMVFRRLSTLQKLTEVYVSIKMLVRNSTPPHRMKQRFFIIQCSCRNEFTNLIKISHCWLNKIQAMQDH